jgi:hypothetical protein
VRFSFCRKDLLHSMKPLDMVTSTLLNCFLNTTRLLIQRARLVSYCVTFNSNTGIPIII